MKITRIDVVSNKPHWSSGVVIIYNIVRRVPVILSNDQRVHEYNNMDSIQFALHSKLRARNTELHSRPFSYRSISPFDTSVRTYVK